LQGCVHQCSSSITVLDTDELSAIAMLEAPHSPCRVAFTLDGSTALEPQPENSVAVLSLDERIVVHTLPAGAAPDGIVVLEGHHGVGN